ncbi:MAG: type II toxin-antitoxin system PrlF family antitoxin [Lautropia sp.]|nr:type II toxin-antitoxin system PrlF family antitoxin [Lautropia sp.]
MPVSPHAESTLTDRYHTTVPETAHSFLDQDMRTHPEHLQALDSDMVRRLQALVAGIEVDLDARLQADDE